MPLHAGPFTRSSVRVVATLTLALGLMLSVSGTARSSAPATASPWTTFSPAEGMAGSSVLALYQDAAGFLWVGTTAGLSVYSPQGDWQTITIDDGILGVLVLEIIGDPADSDRIWLATERGVTLIDHAGQPLRPAGYRFTHFTTADGLTGNYASALALDAAGRLWVGASRINASGNEDGYGLSVVDLGGTPDDKSDDQVRSYIADTGSLTSNVIRDIAVDPGGVVWVATSYGLNAFSADTWTSYLTSNGMPTNEISGVIVDGARLWVATIGGIMLLDHKGTPHTTADDRRAMHLQPTTRPEPAVIERMVLDSAGRIWFGSGHLSGGGIEARGLGVFDPGEDPFVPAGVNWGFLTTDEGMASNVVRSISLAAPNQLWVGTPLGLNRLSFGASPFSAADDSWELFTADSRLAGASVQAIVDSGPDGVWLGTDRGLSYLDYNASPGNRRDDTWLTYSYANDYLADDYIRTLAIDPAGRIWVGTYYGLSIIDPNGTPGLKYDDLIATYIAGATQLAHNQINDITIDSAGRAWIASGDYFSGALQVLTIGEIFNEYDDSWVTFSMATSSIPDHYVRAVAVGAPGVAWVGTQSGVARLAYGPNLSDGSDDVWTVFTSANSGLAFDSVRDILIDRAGNVWFALTLEGVSVYSASGAWQSFSRADGLANNVVRGLLIDRSGLVWAGTAGGGISVLNHGGTLADKRDDRWYQFAAADGPGSSQIQALRLDRWGQVWAGTAGGGASLYSTKQWSKIYLPLAEQP